MKIVLIGYMASGKSTIGKQLAKALDYEFVDLDSAIEKDCAASISELFEKKGELFFRKKEAEILNQLLDSKTDMVLSVGGGTPCYGLNMDTILEKAEHSIYLQLSVNVLVERIKVEKQDRPLVSAIADNDLPEFIGKHLFERRQFYSKAKHTIASGDKTVDALVNEIKSLL